MAGSESTRLAREVNPVFTTAQACLLVMAEAKDADAQTLARELGFDFEAATIDEDALTGMEAFKRMKAIPGFTTMIEARFTASSKLAQSWGTTAVVDLPCGYTPRGLKFSRNGTPYLGLDLPTVVSAMQAVCDNMG